jgi:C-terminal processing protease CtpA/Prc
MMILDRQRRCAQREDLQAIGVEWKANEDGTEGDLQALGIEWPETPQGHGLVVTAVNEGLFADWNESQTEDPVAKVQVGDRIMRVGGAMGGALAVSKAIQKVSGKFQLTLVRAAPELFDEGQKTDGSSHWRFSY